MNGSSCAHPILVTESWHRFISYPPGEKNILHQIQLRWRNDQILPSAWVVTTGVHDCWYFRHNISMVLSGVDRFFNFLDRNPWLASRTLIVGMQFMDNIGSRAGQGSNSSLSQCSRMLHHEVTARACKHHIRMMPRFMATEAFAKQNGSSLHYPSEIAVDAHMESLFSGLRAIISPGRCEVLNER